MRLSIQDVEKANLAWVYDVVVQEGEMKDPGLTVFYKLILAKRPASIKESRVSETTLQVVLDKVTDDVLDDIKEKLLRNSSLAESHVAIRDGQWYRSTADISHT